MLFITQKQKIALHGDIKEYDSPLVPITFSDQSDFSKTITKMLERLIDKRIH